MEVGSALIVMLIIVVPSIADALTSTNFWLSRSGHGSSQNESGNFPGSTFDHKSYL